MLASKEQVGLELWTTYGKFHISGDCKVKVSQSCRTLRDPMDSIVHGVLQAMILEWVAFPSPGDLPNPGIRSRSPTMQADSLPAEPQGKPRGLWATSKNLSLKTARNWILATTMWVQRMIPSPTWDHSPGWHLDWALWGLKTVGFQPTCDWT